MLPVEDALQRILDLCDVLPAETKPISDALGQLLADDVVAPFDIPPLDNTAMDGYAVQAADTQAASDDHPIDLNVIGELAAGYLYEGAVGPGQAVRIMTGAPLPDGADAIVPFEETDEQGLRAPGQQHGPITRVAVLKSAQTGANIRYRAEDVQQGKTILNAGMQLRAAQLAVLASLGVAEVRVVRRPVVAILSTGDELLSPGDQPAPGKIFDSNASGLAALVQEYGGLPLQLGIARDTIDALTAKIREATAQADLVVTSAGVSRGDFDVVKEVLAREGAVDFWTVRMKPGKPLAFGRFDGPDGRKIPHIGLPGNPVSSLLAFELFGRPALHKMQGRTPQPRPMVRAIADEPIINTDSRRVYARAIMSLEDDGRWHARLTGPQGSGVLTSLAFASGFAICPEDVDQIDVGQEVDVLMIGWDHADS
jgi:molybdopterin molybdotransferase